MIYALAALFAFLMGVVAFSLGFTFGKLWEQDSLAAASEAREEAERAQDLQFDKDEAAAIRNVHAWQQAALEAFAGAEQVTFVHGDEANYPMPPKPVEPGFGKTQPSTVVEDGEDLEGWEDEGGAL